MTRWKKKGKSSFPYHNQEEEEKKKDHERQAYLVGIPFPRLGQ